VRRPAAPDDAVTAAPLTVEPVVGRSGVARLEGEVDASNVARLATLTEGLAQDGRVTLVLDGLHYLDSAGFAFLVELAGRVDLRLVAAPDAVVRRAMDILALGELIPVFERLDDAEGSAGRSA